MPSTWLLRRALPCLLASVTALALQGCANTTRSGVIGLQRSQLMLHSSEKLNAEAALGFSQLSQAALSQKKLNTDAAMTQRVRKIGNALIAQVDVFRPDARQWGWEINVFESDEVNAFCAPGGKIGVFTGIVRQLQLTDAELAAVMGHEIAHALREHSREKQSQQTAAGLTTLVVSAATGLDHSLMSAGTQMLVHLPNSRAMELESDIMGLELMARAGYDPRHATSIWKKMQRLTEGKQGPSFLRTHPTHDTRIAELEAYVPKVLPLYEDAITPTSAILRH